LLQYGDKQLSRSPHREYRHLLGIVAAVVVVASLYFARIVFIPLALAILVAVVLTPPVSFLERLRLGRGLSIFVVMAGLVGIATLIGWTVLPQFGDLMAKLPDYEHAVQFKIDKLKGATAGKLGNATQSVQALEKDITGKASKLGSTNQTENMPPGSSPSQPMPVQVVSTTNPLSAASALFGPLATGLAVLVFAVFILAGREDLRNRLIKLTSGGRLNLMTQAMTEAWNRINRYLFMQVLVNSCYGLAIGIALHFIGVPKASLWGFSAGVLRYLPYVGWPIAALMPTALALAVFPGWGHAIITFCIFAGLEFVVANGIEPLLYGSHVGLAPLAILVSAVFWTLIWGFPGLLLSTPIGVCLIVVGRYVPSLGFLSILLGNEPAMAPSAQYYQRLLAGDETEARQILESYLSQSTLEDLYDSVVIPALARSEMDGHRNELDEETRSFIANTTREIAEEIAPASYPGAANEIVEGDLHGRLLAETPAHLDVLCVPARDEADEVVAMLLCQLLERQGVQSEGLNIVPLSEMLERVAELRPDTVCISALPPLAMNHTRTLYAKLRKQYPETQIVVCLWHLHGDPQKTANLLGLASRDRFFSTLPEALRYFSGDQAPGAQEVAHQANPA
jgi:predicted PurR-regulated permease PerM